MKILLISPSVSLGMKTPTGLMIPQLALHILEGMTPPGHQVKIVEEESEVLDLDEDCDLVGISCMTANAPRAYDLAAEFRKRGRKVVLGGVHPTILPDEAGQFADSVVVGEAEDVWEQVLLDSQNGGLKKRYHSPSPNLEKYIPMNIRKDTKRRLFNVIPIMSTRGCPYSCEFCCVSDLFGKTIRHAPVCNVVRDIQESRGKNFIFLDDNIIGNPRYAKELFTAVAPLNIKWVGQSSISFVQDQELMRLAVKSGCVALFFGLESVSKTQKTRMRKLIKGVGETEEAVKKIRDLGIHFHASFVFGFDSDTKSIFPETLDFLSRTNIPTASFNILTPYPGTRIHQQFQAENRLIATDWKYYDHSTVVYKPMNMTPYELQQGEIETRREFTKFSAILKRLPGNMSHPLLHIMMNLGSRKNGKKDPQRLEELATEISGFHSVFMPVVPSLGAV